MSSRFAYTHNPALQSRSIIVLGCISKEVDDIFIRNLLQVLVKVRAEGFLVVSWSWTDESIISLECCLISAEKEENCRFIFQMWNIFQLCFRRRLMASCFQTNLWFIHSSVERILNLPRQRGISNRAILFSWHLSYLLQAVGVYNENRLMESVIMCLAKLQPLLPEVSHFIDL